MKPPSHAPPPGPSRRFLDLLRSRGGVDPSRLRIGTIVLATMLYLGAAFGLGAFTGLPHPPAAPQPRAAARVPATSSPSPPPSPAPSSPPEAPSSGPGPGGGGGGPESEPSPPVEHLVAAPPPPPPASPPPASPAADPPLTYANHLIVGPGAACCSSGTGQWTRNSESGYPDFSGPALWTRSSTATYQWNLGQPTGGRRWDQVQVRVWIANKYSGAIVRYTVTATNGGGQQSQSFQVVQPSIRGWYTIPATFSIGTPFQRTGTLTVRLTYVSPYVGPKSPACPTGNCNAMAAAQVEFLWS
ncbi:MAG TPA: hypothetical protein VFD49_18675 [Candidatus Dormibacteraeota bacterium]|nr:hypothetical protein [Candidatus Dormibacteraeota bacterium]